MQKYVIIHMCTFTGGLYYRVQQQRIIIDDTCCDL